jgi:3'-5' exoribonuclease
MSVKRNTPIGSWENGDHVQGYALVSRREARQDKNGKTFLDVELSDVSGAIPAKIWGDSAALESDFAAYDFVAFKGSVKLYRDALQLSIDQCRRANDSDRALGFDENLLIPSTREDITDLRERLGRIFPGEIRRPILARLARETLAVYGQDLYEHPAAKGMHHAYRGGLLEHVVSMAELALTVAAHYRDLDRDVLLLGVLFHDLGKIRELGAMPANDYTLEGRLVGHVVIGRDLLLERTQLIPGFPDDLRLHLEHLVLSHQGKKEFSAAVEPMTLEALVLHFIDDLDAKVNQVRLARETGTGMQFMKGLGRFFLLDRLEPADGAAPADEEPPGVAEPQGTLF